MSVAATSPLVLSTNVVGGEVTPKLFAINPPVSIIDGKRSPYFFENAVAELTESLKTTPMTWT
jgi:hypothetical protein